LIHLSDVTLRRGPEPLLEAASVSIFAGEKIGIVGRNGSGKSSLLALLRGDLQVDHGDLTLPPAMSIATVAQSLPHGQQPAIEFVIDGDQALRNIEQGITAARAGSDGIGEASLLHDYEAAGGYTARSRAATILDGLGFDTQVMDRPLDQFSGGMRMRVSLARALMCPADLLILDEPTNHLDLDAVVWLEGWLQEFRGTLLLVSHDREFLDAVVTRILQIRTRRLRAWSGNYSQFESAEVEERRRSSSLAARQQVRIREVQTFVDRFRAQATKARQVQSRIKWLEKLPAMIEARDEHAIDWDFAAPRKLPQPLLTLDKVAAGYADRCVLRDIQLTIGCDDRIGILGRNGAGKSTLMRLLARELTPQRGAMTPAPDLAIGFFAQMELEQLADEATAIAELTRRGGDEVARWTEQQKRDHLGRFGFSGERAFETTGRFSGGERARLTLAILVARRPNLLLLDEPTNHLDMEMRASLLLALQNFAGAVVVVSHDRALLRSICDRLLLVDHGRVSEFAGDLNDYANYLQTRIAASSDTTATPDAASSGSSASDRRDQRRREAEARNRLAPLRAELRTLEKQLAAAEARRTELDRLLADGDFYARATAAEQQQTSKERSLMHTEIERLETAWLETSERLGAAENS
jgi:ATP-binding cassette subfamily F protein 3